MTYNQLLALRDDIIFQQQTSASFFYFSRARVDRFFSQNTFQLNILKSRMDEFVTKYVKHDENGQPCKEKKEDRDYYVFETDENKQKYSDAVTNFLKIKTTIEI